MKHDNGTVVLTLVTVLKLKVCLAKNLENSQQLSLIKKPVSRYSRLIGWGSRFAKKANRDFKCLVEEQWDNFYLRLEFIERVVRYLTRAFPFRVHRVHIVNHDISCMARGRHLLYHRPLSIPP